MTASFSFDSLLLRQTKAESDFVLVEATEQKLRAIDNFSPISPAWCCVTPAGDVRFGLEADMRGAMPRYSE